MIQINEESCPKNHRCPVISACPVGAIEQENPYSAPKINEDKCSDCGLCTNYCPVFSSQD
ncbi:4Fe-4S binding protein [Bacteroidota bacterium]